jgi:hypothetical protein
MQSWADFADAVRQSAHVIPGTAFLPLWFSNSEDLVECPKADALDAIDRR